MMILDHIQLAMPPGQEDIARTFFVDLLGMTEETKPAPLAARGGCWFRADCALVHIGADENFRPQKKAHPAFVVPNLDTLAQVLSTSSYVVRWDESLTNRRRFYVDDPFGNRIEFLQDGDGFSQRGSGG